MIDLFRYIEQSFVVTPAKTDAIDVSDTSDFQNKLRSDLQSKREPQEIREGIENFIDKYAAATAPGIKMGEQYLDLHRTLLKPLQKGNDIKDEIEKIFHVSSKDLATSVDFKKDKQSLNDLIIAIKMVSGFSRVPANDMIAMRQAIAFIETTTAKNYKNPSHDDVKNILLRPMLVPSVFLKQESTTSQETQPRGDSQAKETDRVQALLKHQADLQTTYESLMALNPDELQVSESKEQKKEVKFAEGIASNNINITERLTLKSQPSAVTLKKDTADRLSDTVKTTLNRSSINIAETPLIKMVDVVKKNWVAVSNEAMPYLVPSAAKVYQLGAHTFAIQDLTLAPSIKESSGPLSDPQTAFGFSAGPSATAPDFSFAITKPVGVGNLQVVRQELLGYEAGEISHIENIMESELFRRSNRRSETNELTTIQETETTQMEERDLQSTERNELVKEAQKEAGNQKSGSQGQSTSTDYGKLVENNKSNYAKTVTERAVNSLTQRVRSERIQKEKKTYTERTVHEFDNRQADAKKIHGIYQWVDKKYRNRIMNYGQRLLYDVVLPEPASFLIESLKKAQQPESFQLKKPIDPSWLNPVWLNAANYMWIAKVYGVVGSVQPPPDEFTTTIAEVKNDKVEKIKDVRFFTTKLKIQDGYQAVRCYIINLNSRDFSEQSLSAEEKNTKLPLFEFAIGETRVFFGYNNSPDPSYKYINFNMQDFLMSKEEGELPLLFRTYSPVHEFGFAVGINCKRKDSELEKWKLKTFAAITEGYRRQLADYEDKLAQRQATIRTQMMLTQNFARNPSVEITELKRMFIHLLVSEHLPEVGLPPPVSNQFFFLTDPKYVKKWGAIVAFFERAFEWENIMYFYYPYFYGNLARWGELILIQDLDPQFEEFLKAGAVRVVIPVRPGFEAAMAHYHETGAVWLGEELPNIFGELYVSIISEIKARNFASGEEKCVAEWDVKLPTTLVMLKDDAILPKWTPTVDCIPSADK